MSLFSFIAFPRKADLSCLISRIDYTKMVKVKDLKGTKWERNYTGVPGEQTVYLGSLSDFHDLQIHEIDIGDTKVAFKEVFNNRFIYTLTAQFLVSEFLIPNNLEQSTEFYNNINHEQKGYAERCRKQLYDLVKFNTNYSEVVEIYSDWCSIVNDRNCKTASIYGPPTETRTINTDEILSSELLELDKRIKIEIRNTHTK